MTNRIDPDLPNQTRDIYRTHAVAWDKGRNRTLFERRWLEHICAYLPRNADVLDIGCGAGEPIAKYFIDRNDVVTGVDFAPEMLRIARKRWPAQTWIDADMRTLALGKTFDAVLAFNSFFHLTGAEQRTMFTRFAAHLKPGGLLWFTSGPKAGEVTGTVAGQTVFHASLSPEDYRHLLLAAGFDVLRFTPEDPTCAGHSLWLARLKSADLQAGK